MPRNLDNSVTVAVCIITRQRTEGLRRVLEGIARQRLSERYCSRLHVIVVDNDPIGSGLQVCEGLRSSYPWTLDYALEPTVGIPFARNRGIDIAITSNDLLAFLDDDEVPSEAWLAELLRVWFEYSPDVVFGPVAPYFPDPVPHWIERGAFFDREAHPTGTRRSVGATNNVLMSTNLLTQSGVRFDETYRFSGGSDTVFFERVHAEGYRMIWADEALVTEWIPHSRANLKWLAMRHFRNGANRTRREPIWLCLQSITIGIARVAFGAACSIMFLPFGWHRSAKAIRWASYGLGLLYGATGNHFDEYVTVRGV